MTNQKVLTDELIKRFYLNFLPETLNFHAPFQVLGS